jgi:hypothetical protein
MVGSEDQSHTRPKEGELSRLALDVGLPTSGLFTTCRSSCRRLTSDWIGVLVMLHSAKALSALSGPGAPSRLHLP